MSRLGAVTGWLAAAFVVSWTAPLLPALETIRQACLEPVSAADLPALITALVAAASWSLVLWSGCVGLLVMAAALPGAAGRMAGWSVRRLAPATTRRVAAMMLGVSLAGAVGSSASATYSSDIEPGGTRPSTGASNAVTTAPGKDLARGVTPPLGGMPAEGKIDLEWPGLAPPAASGAPQEPAGGAPTQSVDPASDSHGTSSAIQQRPDSARDDKTVVVQPGDTLWEIAARYLPAEASHAEIAQQWPRWYATNRVTVGADPDLLIPGEQLVPPALVSQRNAR